ncbi:hypothetical protein CEXT_208001 [Caerostris extrusa]|uniref:Uncharacterized protein n=1 Tax=Caerostris extrusa TaxID=172846 RepID=A0AAV4U0L5_CAEEX|nr:hypothetical protein CEXT_208001 [Caerostris extrusa]
MDYVNRGIGLVIYFNALGDARTCFEDFRRKLPVIPKVPVTSADEINAYLNQLFLWPRVNKVKLRTNMGIQLFSDEETSHFVVKLLHIGEGTFPQFIV